jgi:hypothetical protein
MFESTVLILSFLTSGPTIDTAQGNEDVNLPPSYTNRAGPRHVGARSRLTIWYPFKSIILTNVFNVFSRGGEKLSLY